MTTAPQLSYLMLRDGAIFCGISTDAKKMVRNLFTLRIHTLEKATDDIGAGTTEEKQGYRLPTYDLFLWEMSSEAPLVESLDRLNPISMEMMQGSNGEVTNDTSAEFADAMERYNTALTKYRAALSDAATQRNVMADSTVPTHLRVNPVLYKLDRIAREEELRSRTNLTSNRPAVSSDVFKLRRK